MDTVLCGFSSMYLGSLDLHLFSRSPADGHEGCCLFGAAVNICVHKFSFPESLEKLVAPATPCLRFHGGAAARSAAVPASVHGARAPPFTAVAPPLCYGPLHSSASLVCVHQACASPRSALRIQGRPGEQTDDSGQAWKGFSRTQRGPESEP